MRKSKVRRLSNIMKTKQQNELDFHKEGDGLDNIDVLQDADGRRYSYNNATEKYMWVDPEVEEEVEVEGQMKEKEKEEPAQAQEQGESQGEISQNELEIEIDEASGRRYAYDKQTGISSWVDDE
jgi:hypothetical protein